jgi:hypothetical protein
MDTHKALSFYLKNVILAKISEKYLKCDFKMKEINNIWTKNSTE